MKVDPAAIRRFADVLDVSSDHTVKARDYERRYGNLTFEQEGLLATARFVHDDFLANLTGTLDHLHDLLQAAKTELYKAADYYAQTDARSVERADATYPAAPRPNITPV